MVDSSFTANDDLVKKKTFGSDLDPPLHNVIRVGGRFIPHASGRAHIIPYPRSMPRRMDHVVCPTQFRVHYAYKYICIHRIDNILALIYNIWWVDPFSTTMYDLWIEKNFLTLFQFLLTKIDNENERKFTIVFPIWNEEPSLLCINVRLVCHNWNKKHIPIVISSTKRTRRTLTHKLIPSFSVSTNSLSYHTLSLWVVVLDER